MVEYAPRAISLGQTNKRIRGIITFLDKQGRRDSNPRQQFTTDRKEDAKRVGGGQTNGVASDREALIVRRRKQAKRVEENAAESRIEHPSCRTRNVISASLRFYNHPVTSSLSRPIATVQRMAKEEKSRKTGGILCRSPAKRTLWTLFSFLSSKLALKNRRTFRVFSYIDKRD